MKKIYQQTVEEVLDRVKSRESGLTDEEVKRSREACGWNELTEGKKKSILLFVLRGTHGCVGCFWLVISSVTVVAVALRHFAVQYTFQ